MNKEQQEAEKNKLISPVAAARRAVEYFKELTGSTESIMLEEIEEKELDNKKQVWDVTLSYMEYEPSALGMGSNKKRYKSILIGAHSGEVLSMKIKTIR